jgi:hypothetical protein
VILSAASGRGVVVCVPGPRHIGRVVVIVHRGVDGDAALAGVHGLEVEVEVEGLGVCVLEAVPLVVAWVDV